MFPNFMKAKASIAQIGEAEIEASTEEMESFFAGILPGFAKEFGGIMTDTVRFWRWKNQVNIVRKARTKIEEAKLEGKPTQVKLLAPIMEGCSVEEDESLQEKWVNLLANAVTGITDVETNFVDVLKSLSPLDAKVLDYCFDKHEEFQRNATIAPRWIGEQFSLSDERVEFLIEKLLRLNLIRLEKKRSFGISWSKDIPSDYDMFGTSTIYPSEKLSVKQDAMEKLLDVVKDLSKKMHEMTEENEDCELTAFGLHFLRACKWSPASSPQSTNAH